MLDVNPSCEDSTREKLQTQSEHGSVVLIDTLYDVRQLDCGDQYNYE